MDNQLGCSHRLLASYRSTCCLNQHQQTEWKHLGLKSYRCTAVQRTSCQDLSRLWLPHFSPTPSHSENHARQHLSTFLYCFYSHLINPIQRLFNFVVIFYLLLLFHWLVLHLNPDCTHTQDLHQWCYIFFFVSTLICIWNSLNSLIPLKP